MVLLLLTAYPTLMFLCWLVYGIYIICQLSSVGRNLSSITHLQTMSIKLLGVSEQLKFFFMTLFVRFRKESFCIQSQSNPIWKIPLPSRGSMVRSLMRRKRLWLSLCKAILPPPASRTRNFSQPCMWPMLLASCSWKLVQDFQEEMLTSTMLPVCQLCQPCV